MELITQKRFVERYKNGERIFSNALLQFFDISDMEFNELIIKNSKVLFCTFRNCNMRNMVFENCEIYGGSFYNGKISSVIFSGCNIELTLFEGIQFEMTKLDRCNIRLCAIFNSNHTSVDFSTSVQNRLLTDVSQLTRADIESSIAEAMPLIERLDVSIRMKLKEILRQDMNRYNLSAEEEKKTSSYGPQAADNTQLSYGEVRHLIESAFGTYSHQNKYEMKSPYETSGKNKTKRAGPPF
jgi:Pentapeptide repeats (9 copies)